MSDYDLMEEGCEGCVRLLAKINELRIDLNNISMAPKTVLDAREGAFHDALSFAGLDPVDGYTEEEALRRFGKLADDYTEAVRKYERAIMLQKFIEKVAQAAPENTPLREQAQAILEEGGSSELDRDKKIIVAAAITNCILTMCSYCKASHDTGMTTEHSCIAKPLWNLWDKKMAEISDE
jgi:hypothetical protein